MSSKKHRRRLSSGPQSLPFDDGVDPRKYFHPSENPQPNHKSLQLCAQVREALNATLAGECRDAVLQSLFVAHVAATSGTNRLVVTIELSPDATKAAVETALDRLEVAKGFLRSRVAAAICRRRAPELEFRAAPPSPAPGGGEVDA